MTCFISLQVQHRPNSRPNEGVTASVAVTSCTCCRHLRPSRSWMHESQYLRPLQRLRKSLTFSGTVLQLIGYLGHCSALPTARSGPSGMYQFEPDATVKAAVHIDWSGRTGSRFKDGLNIQLWRSRWYDCTFEGRPAQGQCSRREMPIAAS